MRTLWILFLIALLVPRAARADDKRARAKHHVTEGVRAQEAARYEEAIAHYQEAYRLVPHPEILFNLGQAYRLEGDEDRALVYYRRYLAADPEGRVVEETRRWIAELEAAIDAREQAAAAAAAARRDRGRPLRIAGLASGGVGVVLVGVSVKLGVDARRISDELSQHEGAWTDAVLARQDAGERAERSMFVCAGVGAAALVAGGVLYLLGSRDAMVAPQVDRETVGVVAVGRF